MMNLLLSPESIAELGFYRFHHPHPRVQLKMEVLLLKARGLRHDQIANIAGVCENTVRSYLKEHKQGGGIEQTMNVRFYKPTSQLLFAACDIKTYFEEHG